MARGRRERGAALGLALTLCAPVPSATAGGPEDAAQAREGIVETVEMLPPGAAVERLATEGYRLKDPLLLLESAERALARAEAATDEGPLLEALPHVAVALDMLHFLGSDRSRRAWRPVAPEDVDAAIARAEALEGDLKAKIQELQDARAAALVAAQAPPPASGKGRITSGAVMLTLGVSGAAVAATGLILGRQAQSKVDDPAIYGNVWDDWDRKGRNANMVAYIGAGVAGLGLAVGIPLLVSGVRAKKRATQDDRAASLRVLPSLNGLSLMGRF